MKPNAPFFVGWAGRVPKQLKLFLSTVCVFIVIGFAGMSLVTGATQEDPEGGRFRFDFGRQDLQGVVIGGPYPALWVTQGTEAVPARQAILLNGNGKTGVQDRINGLAGKAVAASGIVMERGTLRMLQLAGGKQGLSLIETTVAVGPPAAQDLGRWRLSGEICDGRCVVGAMRPGEGLAHKACANLCISGGQPPIFVSAHPVQGETFFLMMETGGKPVSNSVLNRTAEPITLEGALTRIGNMMVFTVDPQTIARP